MLQADVLVVGRGFVFKHKYQHCPIRPILVVSLLSFKDVFAVRPREEPTALREAPDNRPLVSVQHLFKPLSWLVLGYDYHCLRSVVGDLRSFHLENERFWTLVWRIHDHVSSF